MNSNKTVLNLFLILLSIFSGLQVFAQEDLMKLAESEKKEKDFVFATFKDTRIVNLQTCETTKKKSLDFLILHRFGNAGVEPLHTLFGLDNSRDIRIAFNYGLTDNLDINIGRSKYNELIDLGTKWRFINQTSNFHMPVSVALYLNCGINAQSNSVFYSGITSSSFNQKFIHRMDFVSQLIIASKINSNLSIEVLPSFYHRNFVKGALNPQNNLADVNQLFSVGGGIRYKLTKRFSIVADYLFTFSEYRKNNPVFPYYQPMGIGAEIETGGHIFHLYVSNSGNLMENNFIPSSPDSWNSGGYKLGFRILRSFYLGQ